MQKFLLLLVSGYRYLISPLLGYHCRFHPSCSCYAHTAIARFGAWRGLRLALRRLSHCHPWHEGGFDPVPECVARADTLCHNHPPQLQDKH